MMHLRLAAIGVAPEVDPVEQARSRIVSGTGQLLAVHQSQPAQPQDPRVADLVDYLTASSVGRPVKGLAEARDVFRVGRRALNQLLDRAEAHGFGPTRVPGQGGSAVVWWPSESVAKCWFEVVCALPDPPARAHAP